MKLLSTTAILTLTALSSAAIASNSLPVPNQATVTLRHVIALQKNGDINKQPNAKELCLQIAQPLLGQQIQTRYVTSADSSHQVASSKLEGQIVIQYPEGLQGQYSYMSSSMPSTLKNQKIKSVDFSVGPRLGDPTTSVMLRTNNPNVFCVVSNNNI